MKKKFLLFYLRSLRDWLIAKFVLALRSTLRLFPSEASINFMEKLGRRFGVLLPRTKVARENLIRAFPEKTPDEIEKILVDMWGHLARTAAEYNYLDNIFDFDPSNFKKSRIEFLGEDIFAKLVKDNRPAIFFTAHTGNWEILPIGAACYGVEVTALFRPPSNKFIADQVLSARKTRLGYLVPSKAGSSWVLSGLLRNNKKIGILVDQYFHKGTEINFFGQKALANPLLAKLVRQYNCQVYPARCVRLPENRFRLELQPAVDIPYLENKVVDVKKLTQLVNTIVEDWVREYPEQWLWIHNRWR